MLPPFIEIVVGAELVDSPTVKEASVVSPTIPLNVTASVDVITRAVSPAVLPLTVPEKVVVPLPEATVLVVPESVTLFSKLTALFVVETSATSVTPPEAHLWLNPPAAIIDSSIVRVSVF